MIANPSDEATRLGYYWMERFAKYAASKGHQVIFQKTPTLQTLYKALTTYDPQLVVANGHGGFKSLKVGENVLIGIPGYDKATHRKLNHGNPEYFTGRIILLLTCNAGRELVKTLVSTGAKAAMGYQEPFIFMSDETLNPDQDKGAKPFFESLLQPAIQLADGATFKQAIDATRETFQHYIKGAAAAGEDEVLKYEKFDLENLVALGDPNAKLS